jgi:FkbM family methyltransferase
MSDSKLIGRLARWGYSKAKFVLKRHYGLTTVNERYFMRANEVVHYLQKRGHEIKVVYDIGAYVGDWTKELVQFYPDLSAILIEPNVIHNEKLSQVSGEVYNEVLGSKETELAFYSVDGTGDSVFLENTRIYQEIEPRFVMATTLDILVSRENLRMPDLVKIDCQGSEADVILGGSKVLKHAKALIIETSLFELNFGGSRIEQILDVSEKLGFIPIAISGCNFRNEQLVQIDFVLLNTRYINSDKMTT